MLDESVLHILEVSVRRLRDHILRNDRVLLEDVGLEELLGDRESLDILVGDEDELALLVRADVVVADHRVLLHEDTQLVLFLGEALAEQVVADAYSALLDEVHLRHLVLLVVDQLLVLVRVELPRSQAKGNVVEELVLFVRLVVEEEPEVVENVVE